MPNFFRGQFVIFVVRNIISQLRDARGTHADWSEVYGGKMGEFVRLFGRVRESRNSRHETLIIIINNNNK